MNVAVTLDGQRWILYQPDEVMCTTWRCTEQPCIINEQLSHWRTTPGEPTYLFISYTCSRAHAYFSEHVWSGGCLPGEPDRCCVSVHMWQWIQTIKNQRVSVEREQYANRRDNYSITLTSDFSVTSLQTRRETHRFTFIYETMLVVHLHI